MNAAAIKRTVIFKHQGHKVTIHIWAYRRPDDDFARSCFADFLKNQGRKKLKADVELTFRTTLGASDPS